VEAGRAWWLKTAKHVVVDTRREWKLGDAGLGVGMRFEYGEIVLRLDSLAFLFVVTLLRHHALDVSW
jgi:hypothetical protein